MAGKQIHRVERLAQALVTAVHELRVLGREGLASSLENILLVPALSAHTVDTLTHCMSCLDLDAEPEAAEAVSDALVHILDIASQHRMSCGELIEDGPGAPTILH